MNVVATVNRIGTAVPTTDVHRTFLDYAGSLLPARRERALFQRMVERGGIEHRWSVLSLAKNPGPGDAIDTEGYYRPGQFPSTALRMRLYEKHALALAVRAVRDLGRDVRLDQVTHLVVVSCTGFVAPGLDLGLVQALGLDPGVERTLVGFMGCYAALNGLKLARHMVRSQPDAKVLVVCVELCTLHFQETTDLERMLAFSLFGDGAAAALVSAEPEGIALDAFSTTLVAEEPELISWRIGDQGFDMVLSGKVPATLQRALRERAEQLSPAQAPVDAWLVHPGGRSILDAVDEAFALPREALAHSRAVLAENGNMSSATLLFVAKRWLESGATAQRGLAMAFGPGLTAEMLSFRRLA